MFLLCFFYFFSFHSSQLLSLLEYVLSLYSSSVLLYLRDRRAVTPAQCCGCISSVQCTSPESYSNQRSCKQL